MVVEEVRRLRADLQSTKEDLQRTHTELAAVQAEANRFSLSLTGVKQDLEREGRTCKTLEAEVKELRGEPQASTRGLTGVQCGRGEGCNAMSQQNLEEEAGCGQADRRKMKKQAMAKRTADTEAGNGQAIGLQKNFLEILLSQAHKHHTVVLSSCHIALL
jgi:chromosome segregation ATPase